MEQVTIRLQCENGGLRFLAYITGGEGMLAQHVDVEATAETNEVWQDVKQAQLI